MPDGYLQQTHFPSGAYNTEPPKLSPPAYGHYPEPANWPNPTVVSQNLVVKTKSLRTVASQIGSLADTLQAHLKTFNDLAGPAAQPEAAGNWSQALQLSEAIRTTHQGVSQFVQDLVDAHTDITNRLNTSADSYENNEAHNAALIKNPPKITQKMRNAGSSTRVLAGGDNQHVNPTYGTNLSPSQAAMVQHLINMDRSMGGGEDWNNAWNKNKQGQTEPFNITYNKPFDEGTTPKVTPDQLQSMLTSVNAGHISNAAQAYQTLTTALTSATHTLAGHGTTLANNWGGANAVTAVSQVQMLHQTASDLQANAWQAGQALTNYHTALTTFQQAIQNNPPTPYPANSGVGVGTNAQTQQANTNQGQANDAATNWLKTFNQQAVAPAYNSLPPQLNQNLPPKPKSASKPKPKPSDGSSGAPGGSSGTPGVPGTPTSPGTPPVSGKPVLSGTGPPMTYPPPPVTTPPPPVTTPQPPIPPVQVPPVTDPTYPDNLNPGGPNDPIPGPSEPEPIPGEPDVPGLPRGVTGVPGGSGSSSDPVGPDDDVPGSGSSLAGETVPGEGEAGFSMPGMGGFGAGAGGGSGSGRSRQSWQSEDEGLWDPADEPMFASGRGTADGMIGSESAGAANSAAAEGSAGWAEDGAGEAGAYPMMGGAGAGRQEEKNRQRQAWMLEDPEIWAPAADEAPPIIG